MADLSVREILAEQEAGLDLEILAGHQGLGRQVRVPKIQKPGLALAGFTENLHNDRIQVLGETELRYLQGLPADHARQQVEHLLALDICCLIITKGQTAPEALVAAANRYQVPLLRTRNKSSTIIALITRFLEERLLPQTTLHGVLVDVLGIGILLLGKSGIGKSECALDLVLRGYRLVADDVVRVRFKVPHVLFGEGLDLAQYHMEVRGLGILNIKHLFGVAAVRERKKIDMAIELVEWGALREEDRASDAEQVYTLLGVDLPLLRLPLHPGRNIASMVEVAARNFVLKDMGYNSHREFQDLLERRMAEAAEQHRRSIIGDNLE